MDGVDRGSSRWRSIKERLGLKGIACCGGVTTWGTRHSTMSVIDNDDEDDDYINQDTPQRREPESSDQPVQELDPVCLDPVVVGTAGSGMNLATALAAERQFRAAQQDAEAVVSAGERTIPGTPLRMSLMRLLEESDGKNGEDGPRGGNNNNNDTVCCVCMIRKKGAAFIPCGHTFCRVCSRELWLNRGFCPLCNRSILEILDIF